MCSAGGNTSHPPATSWAKLDWLWKAVLKPDTLKSTSPK